MKFKKSILKYNFYVLSVCHLTSSAIASDFEDIETVHIERTAVSKALETFPLPLNL